MSNKREPLPSITSNGPDAKGNTSKGQRTPVADGRAGIVRPGAGALASANIPPLNNGRYEDAWSDPNEPFDFMLELGEVDRVSHGLAKQDSSPRVPKFDAELDDHQSNVVTRPPPPLLSYSGQLQAPSAERSSPSASDACPEWDDVTPRSSSMAAALLSSPQHELVSEDPPPSSESADLFPEAKPPKKPRSEQKDAGPKVPPFTNVTPPFTNVTPPFTNVTPPFGAVTPGKREVQTSGAKTSADDSAKADAPDDGARLQSSNTKPGDPFAPSFLIEKAPITPPDQGRRPAPTKTELKKASKWALTVLVAFAIPFVGASVLTRWIESHRFKGSASDGDMPRTATAIGATALPASKVPKGTPDALLAGDSPAATSETAGAPVTLTQSLKGSPVPEGHVAGSGNLGQTRGSSRERETPSSAPAVARVGDVGRSTSTRNRPVTGAPQQGAALTPLPKPGEPSYRVRIPEEQKSPMPRNGAHNVPLSE